MNELAEPFSMSQPAVSRHLKVLERAGLISSGSDAQRRPRRLEARPLAEATAWLEAYREIQVTRDFDAPRPLVFDAFTKPELVRRWLLGPPGWTMPPCEIDLRVGGVYRYVWRSEQDGSQMAMGGLFREVVPLERLVATEKFDDAWYPGEALDTTVFVKTRGITRITITVLYESQEARDTARRSGMEYGMEYGMAAGYDRLEALLPTLAGEHQ